MSDKLTEWLESIPVASEKDAATTTLVGRALSRSDTHLHLATTRGVVTIPLANIHDVRLRFADDPSRVSVNVHGTHEIKLIRKAIAFRPTEDPGPVIIHGGVGTTVCNTTYTGDSEDEATCDDEDCQSSSSDDEIGT